MKERERERDRQTDRPRQRKRDRDRNRQTDLQKRIFRENIQIILPIYKVFENLPRKRVKPVTPVFVCLVGWFLNVLVNY